MGRETEGKAHDETCDDEIDGSQEFASRDHHDNSFRAVCRRRSQISLVKERPERKKKKTYSAAMKR